MLTLGLLLLMVVTVHDAVFGDGWLCAGVVAASALVALPAIVVIVATLKTIGLALEVVPAARRALADRRREALPARPRPNLRLTEAAQDRELARLDRKIYGDGP